VEITKKKYFYGIMCGRTDLIRTLDSTIYSGMILFEIIAIGSFLHSAYHWWSTSKGVKELEALLDTGERE